MFAIITVEGKTEGVQCDAVRTGVEAEKEIRKRFGLEFGGLVDDDTGKIVFEDELLGNRELRFVGGRPTGDYLSFKPAYQFKYTHVFSHSFFRVFCFEIVFLSSYFSITSSSLISLSSHFSVHHIFFFF